MDAAQQIKHKTDTKFQGFFDVLSPPPKLSVSEFAHEHRVVSLEESEESGKWRDWPFQTEMQNVINEPGVKLAVYMTAAQVSKTAQELNIISYIICHRTGGITFMLPTKTMAEDYSKGRFDPMVRDCPLLASIIPPTRSRGNRTLYKKWHNGYLRFIGSENANDVCSFPTPRVVIDEADRCSLVVRNSKGEVEGNTLLLLKKRMSRFTDRFLLMASTPTLEETSITYEHFLKSDQRHPHVSCPFCGYGQFLEWKRFVWDKEGSPGHMLDSFHYPCEACKKPFRDLDFPSFPPAVSWVKHNPGGEFPGFHISQFYTNSWRDLFKEYLECGQNQIKLMSFWNTVLGLPYSFASLQAPDWLSLFERPKSYGKKQLPAPVCLLLAGCDVQDDRLEVVVVGFNRKRMWVIDYEVFYGNTANRDADCWQELSAYAAQRWETENGHSLEILATAIDSRHRKDVVTRFAKDHKHFIPVTGVANTWDQLVLPPRKAELKVGRGVWKEIALSRYPLGVNLLKMDLYARLNLELSASESIDFPQGLSEIFYKQLTGEVLEVKEDARGNVRRLWRKQYTNVEVLDCLVYILGLYLIKSLNNWTEERWQRREAELGLAKKLVSSTKKSPVIGTMI